MPTWLWDVWPAAFFLQQRLNWAIRGAGGPASVFVLEMLPSKMADGTLHTD